MSQNRTKTLLATWLVAFLAAVPALGQGLEDGQFFAPAELGGYGGGPRPSEGAFFRFDGLWWWRSRADTTTVGSQGNTQGEDGVVLYPQAVFQWNDANDDGEVDLNEMSIRPPTKVVQGNSVDTGVLRATDDGGQRYEFGYVSGHHGWLANVIRLNDNTQTFWANNANVVFQDPPFGSPPQRRVTGIIDEWLELPPVNDPIWSDPHVRELVTDDGDSRMVYIDDLPIVFDELMARNVIETWGTELNYMYRMHPCRRGGILELFLGARYLEFDEKFNVQALGMRQDPEDEEERIPYASLADSFWNTKVENHIVGPQVGFRWFRQTGRLTWSTEARGFFGCNYQNYSQQGVLGSELDPVTATQYIPADAGEGLPIPVLNMPRSQFSSGRHDEVWSPGAELRVDLKYQFTRAFSAQVGWTGFWIDGVARASTSINYEVPYMGLDLSNNEQSLFMHGFNFGFEFNR
jgi:hypothetical protein